MRWKRGDVVWLNNTLSELAFDMLVCVVGVTVCLMTLWNILGLLLGF